MGRGPPVIGGGRRVIGVPALVRPTIVEWARTGRGALVGVWCVGELVCVSVRWGEPV